MRSEISTSTQAIYFAHLKYFPIKKNKKSSTKRKLTSLETQQLIPSCISVLTLQAVMVWANHCTGVCLVAVTHQAHYDMQMILNAVVSAG